DSVTLGDDLDSFTEFTIFEFLGKYDAVHPSPVVSEVSHHIISIGCLLDGTGRCLFVPDREFFIFTDVLIDIRYIIPDNVEAAIGSLEYLFFSDTVLIHLLNSVLRLRA